MDPTGRRDQILRNAKSVFARKGYHSAGVSDIIEKAGIARGTFYLYFEGKREVFGAILDILLKELEGLLQPVRLGRGEPEPLVQVRQNVSRVLRLVVDDPMIVRILFQQASALDARSQTTLHRFFDRVHAMIVRSLDLGIRLGILRRCDTSTVAACLFGAVREVVERLAARRDPEEGLDALADEVVRFALTGIARAK